MLNELVHPSASVLIEDDANLVARNDAFVGQIKPGFRIDRQAWGETGQGEVRALPTPDSSPDALSGFGVAFGFKFRSKLLRVSNHLLSVGINRAIKNLQDLQQVLHWDEQ